MIVDSQYVTMFMNSDGRAVLPSVQEGSAEPVFRDAREALKEVYANGWQPFETIRINVGNEPTTNRPQIQLVLHLVKYDNAPLNAKSAKKDA